MINWQHYFIITAKSYCSVFSFLLLLFFLGSVIHSLFFKQNFPHVGNAYMKLVIKMIYVVLVGEGCGQLKSWDTGTLMVATMEFRAVQAKHMQICQKLF